MDRALGFMSFFLGGLSTIVPGVNAFASLIDVHMFNLCGS